MAEGQDIINDINADKARWQNRRRMSWVALISMILLTFILCFTDLADIERLKILTDVVTWYYFTMASIILAYMGATTFAHIKK